MAATFYSQVLREFDWERMAADMEAATKGFREAMANGEKPELVERGCASASETDYAIEACAMLGTVFSVMPSGKFWTGWASSNVTPRDAARDSAYREALDRAAAKFGGSIENGEGDPCDLLFVAYRDIEREPIEISADEEAAMIEGEDTIIAEISATSEPHVGHTMHFTGAWYCDTCQSPYCELA
jgi:hypothetical protein